MCSEEGPTVVDEGEISLIDVENVDAFAEIAAASALLSIGIAFLVVTGYVFVKLLVIVAALDSGTSRNEKAVRSLNVVDATIGKEDTASSLNAIEEVAALTSTKGEAVKKFSSMAFLVLLLVVLGGTKRWAVVGGPTVTSSLLAARASTVVGTIAPWARVS